MNINDNLFRTILFLSLITFIIGQEPEKPVNYSVFGDGPVRFGYDGIQSYILDGESFDTLLAISGLDGFVSYSKNGEYYGASFKRTNPDDEYIRVYSHASGLIGSYTYNETGRLYGSFQITGGSGLVLFNNADFDGTIDVFDPSLGTSYRLNLLEYEEPAYDGLSNVIVKEIYEGNHIILSASGLRNSQNSSTGGLIKKINLVSGVTVWEQNLSAVLHENPPESISMISSMVSPNGIYTFSTVWYKYDKKYAPKDRWGHSETYIIDSTGNINHTLLGLNPIDGETHFDENTHQIMFYSNFGKFRGNYMINAITGEFGYKNPYKDLGY